ncbi:ferredoxin [Nocardioides sp. GCM10027113]|uniref:ferredoxin n=1 Tax=unclassified Nocardioides TaxID=2615069 RepID=UPI00361F9243
MADPPSSATAPARQARLEVDWTRCDGHGTCVELLPELLSLDPWGYPLSRTGRPDPVVPASTLDRARRAVRACPLAALRLDEPAARQRR